ncbi:MAG: hypothetical protein ACR2P5_06950, partial [Gammaproteobacteria bacterium]
MRLTPLYNGLLALMCALGGMSPPYSSYAEEPAPSQTGISYSDYYARYGDARTPAAPPFIVLPRPVLVSREAGYAKNPGLVNIFSTPIGVIAVGAAAYVGMAVLSSNRDSKDNICGTGEDIIDGICQASETPETPVSVNCNEGEVKILEAESDDAAICREMDPAECAAAGLFYDAPNSDCRALKNDDCADNQEAENNRCVNLKCKTGEVAKGHKCALAERSECTGAGVFYDTENAKCRKIKDGDCADNAAVKNGFCEPLTCAPEELAKNHECRLPQNGAECREINAAEVFDDAESDKCRLPNSHGDCEEVGGRTQIYAPDEADNCRTRDDEFCAEINEVLISPSDRTSCRLPETPAECVTANGQTRPIYAPADPESAKNCRPRRDNEDCPAGMVLKNGICDLPSENEDCAEVYGNAQPIFDEAETDKCRLPNARKECRSLHGDAQPRFDEGEADKCRLPNVNAECAEEYGAAYYHDATRTGAAKTACMLAGNDDNCAAGYGDAQPIFDREEDDKCRPRNEGDCNAENRILEGLTCRLPRDGECAAAFDATYIYDADRAGENGTDCRVREDGDCNAANRILDGGECRHPDSPEECKTAFGATYYYDDTLTEGGRCRLPNTRGECRSLHGDAQPRFDEGEADNCRLPNVNAECAEEYGAAYYHDADQTGAVKTACMLAGENRDCADGYGDAQPIFDREEDDKCRPRNEGDCNAENRILEGLTCRLPRDGEC